jgi:serine/threonine protein kinase
MAELEGRTLGRYELRRLIGKGGMAHVYEAYDSQTDRFVAVKIFKREDEEMLRRFIREAQLMASLRHPHLVPIYDSGSAPLDNFTVYYIVMPYMQGGTLRARIRRSPLTLQEACNAMRDIADALDYIHRQGIVHRDIKASNILLNEEGICFLTDFGIARISDDATQLTTTGNVLGTVDYVAPELFEPGRRADARSDLYSLGVLLYEMVTGRLPFYAENQIALVSMHMHRPPPSPRTLAPTIPPQVEQVILRALEKRPEQRYASATELANTFCSAVTASKQQPYGVPPVVLPDEPTIRQDQLILSAPPQAYAQSDGNPGNVRPSPLVGGTEGGIWPANNPRSAASYTPVYPAAPVAPPMQPPAPRPFYRSPLFALFVVTLAVLIIGGSVWLIVMPRPQTGNANNPGTGGHTQIATATPPTTIPSPTPNLTATAQAQANATATARANATATAIAGATATVQAQASATAGVIQTATSGTPAYGDPLNNPNSSTTQAANWDQGDQCSFQSDGYHVKEPGNLKGCMEKSYAYQNLALSVDMHILSGQAGGVFFRVNTNLIGAYSGYLFEVDSTGRYRILASDDYSLGNPNVLQDWKTTSALKTGNATNTLQLIARDTTLFFYANGTFLTQLTDSTFTSQGKVAFLAKSDGNTPAEVVYTNIRIYQLS